MELTRTWDSIRRSYEDSARHTPWLRPMVDLIARIEQSKLSRLHGWMSMQDLHIVQQAVSFPYEGPSLVISPLRTGEMTFEYGDTFTDERRWRRVVPAELAFDRLLRFTDELCWFARISSN